MCRHSVGHIRLSVLIGVVFSSTFMPIGLAYAADKYCTDLLDAAKNPLGKYQWHLFNTAQSSFASEAGTYGEDINAYWTLKDDCSSGSGIRVAVVDTGLELNHPSLKPNIDNQPNQSKSWSLNFRNNFLKKNDPSPIETDDEDHGTMVAGIIAMRSNLGFGGSGVAPHAELTGYNIIHQDTQEFSNFVDSLGGSDASQGNDIFSMSYGYNSAMQIPADEATIRASLMSYKFGVRHLRGGKGALYIKAAGNGFSSLGFGGCSGVKLGLSCQNSSMDPDNSLPEVITIGALNAKGVKASYSTTGSSLWVSAPGGEFSFNKNWVDENNARLGESAVNWSLYRSTIGEPAIITTDVSGSRAGMSKYVDLNDATNVFNLRNEFNACRDVEENLDCNYTNSMNGTSSATPVTSGVVALILEANPNLTWRDVKHVLAVTASKVDRNLKPIEVDLAKGKYVAELGWVQNAVGYTFSNWYGFGRVNATDAVRYVKAHYDADGKPYYPQDTLGNYIENDWFPQYNSANLSVPQGDPNGVTHVVTLLKKDNLVIESVQIQTSVSSESLSDIGFELISPSGTKSVLWNIGNGFYGGDLINQEMQSNAFYGEQSHGKWTLRVVNAGFDTKDATFKGWKIKIVGHKPT